MGGRYSKSQFRLEILTTTESVSGEEHQGNPVVSAQSFRDLICWHVIQLCVFLGRRLIETRKK